MRDVNPENALAPLTDEEKKLAERFAYYLGITTPEQRRRYRTKEVKTFQQLIDEWEPGQPVHEDMRDAIVKRVDQLFATESRYATARDIKRRFQRYQGAAEKLDEMVRQLCTEGVLITIVPTKARMRGPQVVRLRTRSMPPPAPHTRLQ